MIMNGVPSTRAPSSPRKSTAMSAVTVRRCSPTSPIAMFGISTYVILTPYGNSERKAISHHQPGRRNDCQLDGRAPQEHRRKRVSFGSRPALRLESVPGSAAEAVQDPRRPAEAEESEVSRFSNQLVAQGHALRLSFGQRFQKPLPAV